MFHTMSQTKYYRDAGIFPASLELNEYVRRMFGPVAFPRVERDYVHPTEHRCRSLIRSHRATMHFMRDQLTYNVEMMSDPFTVEKVEHIIHHHAMAICHLCACIRKIRLAVALGVTVPVFDTVR